MACRVEHPDTRRTRILISKPNLVRSIECQRSRSRSGAGNQIFRKVFDPLIKLAYLARTVLREPELVIQTDDYRIRNRV